MRVPLKRGEVRKMAENLWDAGSLWPFGEAFGGVFEVPGLRHALLLGLLELQLRAIDLCEVRGGRKSWP